MPLLHKMVVDRMRQSPEGSAPLAVAVHSASMLIGMVAGEVGSPPMAASVGGGPIIANRIAIQTRAERMDGSIQALNRDVRDLVVFVDPSQERAEAEQCKKELADDISAGLPGFMIDAKKKVCDRMEYTVQQLEKQAKGETPEQISKDLAFGSEWSNFYDRWNYDLEHVFESYGFPAGEWDLLDGYETEYFVLRSKMEALGHKPNSLPMTPQSKIDAEHPGLLDKAGSFFGKIPFTSLAVGGLAVGVGLLFLSMHRSEAPARAR